MSLMDLQSDGFMGQLLDRENVMEAGSTLLGGAAGSLLFGLAVSEFDFFQADPAAEDPSREETMSLVKRSGLALGLAVASGAFLWNMGDRQRDAAKGVMGAMGGSITAMVWNRFADDKPISLGQMPASDSIVSLQATRVYQGDRTQIPANIGNQTHGLARTRVGSDPDVFGGDSFVAGVAAY